MSKQVYVFSEKQTAVTATAEFILDWCAARPGAALGGATGRSPIGVWEAIWKQLGGARRDEKESFVARDREAVARMLLGSPGPKNPAAWAATHDAVTVFLDRAALGDLNPDRLERRGWSVNFDPAAVAATG